MRDWGVIVLIVLASLAVCSWLFRRGRPLPIGIVRKRTEQEASAPRSDASVGDVTNTLVPPLPENEVLAVLEFDGSPGYVPIRRGETVIGRHSDDDVRVSDVRVSRHHARISAGIGGAFEIQNLTTIRSEPNPMLVNGESREHAAVADGDVVTLGGVSFTFRRAADTGQLPPKRDSFLP